MTVSRTRHFFVSQSFSEEAEAEEEAAAAAAATAVIQLGRSRAKAAALVEAGGRAAEAVKSKSLTYIPWLQSAFFAREHGCGVKQLIFYLRDVMSVCLSVANTSLETLSSPRFHQSSPLNKECV